MKTIGRSLRGDATVGDPLPVPWPALQRQLQLHTKELAVVAGAPGAGKSVFGLNLAMSLELPVLYLAMDRPTSVFARSAALALDAEVSWVYSKLRDDHGKEQLLREIGDTHPNFFINPGTIQVDNKLNKFGDPGPCNGLEQRIVALTEVLGRAPALVILDNLIDLDVPGYTHTDVGFYASTFGPLKQMAIRHNTCIMALHHVTRRGGESGDPHGLGTRPLRMTDLLYSGEREAEHVIGVFHDVSKTNMTVQILKQSDGDADPEGGLQQRLTWHASRGRLDRA
jgi:hypothetical protein